MRHADHCRIVLSDRLLVSTDTTEEGQRTNRRFVV
jgi:hypothetical protein